METKTSKITQISGNGTWDTPDGKKIYKFEIVVESGDSGMIFKQSQDSGLAIGQELEYYVDAKGNLKIPKKPFTPKQSNVDWAAKDQMIIRQSSLKSACVFHSQSSATIDTVLKTAQMFCDWVNQKEVKQKEDALPF